MPTYTNTSRLGIRIPQANQKVNDFTAIIDALGSDTDVKAAGWLTGTAAGRPAAGTAGRWYYATDTALLYFDTGSGWLLAPLAGSWTAVTLGSGVTAPVVGDFTPAAARVEGDTARLQGFLENTSGGTIASGTTIFTVPSGARPANTVNLLVGLYSNGLGNNTAGLLSIASTGVASMNSMGGGWSTAYNFMALDGLTYPLS